jgi:hypothetical protein
MAGAYRQATDDIEGKKLYFRFREYHRGVLFGIEEDQLHLAIWYVSRVHYAVNKY